MYWPMPDAIVAMPKIEATRYRSMRGTAIFIPKTDSKIDKKLPVGVKCVEIYARESRTDDAETATITHATREAGPAIPAAIPGTTKIPDPIVPPTPRLTSSMRPRFRL
jgi:hypothetical protein